MNGSPLLPSRRTVLAGLGYLIVGFQLRSASALDAQGGTPPPVAPSLPGSLKENPWLDSWIRIGGDGSVAVMTGKAELGQGIKTAILQVAAEELRCDPAGLTIITADTSETPNEGYTAGSHSMQDSATALRNAAAQVREILLNLAASRLETSPDGLTLEERTVRSADGRQVGWGELVSDGVLHIEAQPASKLTVPASLRVIGRSMPRVDIPAKVTGAPIYVQDMRPAGMVHARVVRPPSPGARLKAADVTAVGQMPGVIKVVRDGDFLAVIADKEFRAITAMRALEARCAWSDGTGLPDQGQIFAYLAELPAEQFVILDRQAPTQPAIRTIEARYQRRYQLHGSIGPSCALALFEGDRLTVWSHAQGMFPLRGSLAEMLRLPPEQVRCIHVEGSGCYGHNGADDAAADAALIARALPGRPVRLQLMREQEHMTEPYGPAMMMRAKASLDASGDIVDWSYEVRSNTHSTRPPGAGNLLAARLLEQPFAEPPPKPLPQPEGGGDRNAIPLYRLPNARVLHQFVPEMPLRVSAMRGLGAYANIFAVESFVDELAAASGQDPVAFRLRHLDDARAGEVVRRAAARFDWPGRQRQPGRGYGFAFARYKNLGAYAAIAVEVEVLRSTGRVRLVRAVAAVDAGEIVNPDGLRNQIQGGIAQSTSWTLYEQVTFDRRRITSRDWSTYPILRMDWVPDLIEVELVDRPGSPFLGAGEAAQGPTAAALANGVFDAAGVRLRDLPLDAATLREALL